MFALRRKEYRFLSRLFLPLKSGITLLLSPGNCRRSPTSKNLSFPPPPELVHPSRSRAFFFAFRSITDQQIEQSTASVKNRRARRVRSPPREIVRNTRETSWEEEEEGRTIRWSIYRQKQECYPSSVGPATYPPLSNDTPPSIFSAFSRLL